MIELHDSSSIGETFEAAVRGYGPLPFLLAPANPSRHYDPAGRQLTYDQTAQAVQGLIETYARAGYGLGHRVALLLENRLEHFLHKLALNTLGVCCVPLNPDHRPAEMAYVIEHSEVDLVVVAGLQASLLQQALALSAHRAPVVRMEEAAQQVPPVARRACGGRPRGRTSPACCTPRAPPGDPRAACCRTATSWLPAPGTRSAAG